MSDINQRLSQANQVISIAASCGRRYFHSTSVGRTGQLKLSGSTITPPPFDDHAAPSTIHVIYIEPDTGQHIQVADSAQWSEFTAPPARRLLLAMTDYIKTGRKLPLELIAPRYQTINANMWGYDEDSAQKVRALCSVLPMFGRCV